MRTKRELTMAWGWLGRTVTIPKGTKVVPASNLPGNPGCWIELSETGDQELDSWLDNYGLLVDHSDVYGYSDQECG